MITSDLITTKKDLFGLYFKRFIISLLVFVVPFTQIVSLPVAYALTDEAGGDSRLRGNDTQDEATKLTNATSSIVETAGNTLVTVGKVTKKAAQDTVQAVKEALTIPKAEAISAYAATTGAHVNPPKLPNNIETVYDLVAIVVDINIDRDSGNYVGLSGSYGGISPTTLGTRIVRYAQDIVANNPLTDVKILFYDSSKETVNDIASALENLYINGDGSHNNKLAGVVFIGDIPLPVVNKNGNRYVSVFPYTDFVDKAYIYDNASNTFVKNEKVAFPTAEIWHGIIKPPDNTAAGKQKLAEYLDKNHLFQIGDPEFANFDKKLFFGDLYHEAQMISPDLYSYYLRFVAGLEDLAYMRYNKFWANELSQTQSQEIDADPSTPGGAMLKNLEKDLSDESNPMASMPDIFTKYIIDKSLTPYVKLISKYVAQTNDWADYTGRYSTTDISSVPVLLSIKDEFTKRYLKAVNDTLERKINEIAQKIQEPLPMIESSNLSGTITLNDGTVQPFKIRLQNITKNEDIETPVDSIDVKFNFKNIVNGKFYINGIDAAVMNSPKQCSVYLGSTKNDDFDKNLNYNPKNKDVPDLKDNGKYSIMTRAMRSDDPTTIQPVHTTGIHTRLLNPKDTYYLTNGAYGAIQDSQGNVIYGTYSNSSTVTSGAVIEDNSDYGISAFDPNPIKGAPSHYANPFDGVLKKGDVITRVMYYDTKSPTANDQPALHFIMDPYNTFDTAIENIYQKAKSLIDSNNSKTDEKRVGTIKIYFYRNGRDLYYAQKTFTVLENSELTLGDDSDGAIFTLYGTKSDAKTINSEDSSGGNGYGNQGYDNSAGCNYNNTSNFSDRCFYPIAMMPVLDPAGAVALTRIDQPDGTSKVGFSENMSRPAADGTKSPVTPLDYATHKDMFPYPGGKTKDAQGNVKAYGKSFEEIDDVIMDSCYWGLPSATDNGIDSNVYSVPLDPVAKIDSGKCQESDEKNDIAQDFNGRLLDSFGKFLDFNGGKNGCSVEMKQGEDTVKTSGANLSVSTAQNFGNVLNYPWQALQSPDLVQLLAYIVNPKVSALPKIDYYNSSDITLNNLYTNPQKPDDPPVAIKALTMKDFSDRYALFDKLDNDGDGQVDELDEANKNPIAADDVLSINRKLIAGTNTYVLPESIASQIYPADSATVFPGAKEIKLNVTATPYKDPSGNEKKISSVILHNEPTSQTISQQVNSNMTLSMPIDNPRYVAFQSKPATGQNFGLTQKIYYPNTFDKSVTTYDQLTANIQAMADKMAVMPGAYKLISSGPVADLTLIRDEILKELLPLVSDANDDPTNDGGLNKASLEKVRDAIYWMHANVDEKHRYILKYYLNPNKDAYVQDAKSGYEAAYLVLDGTAGNGGSFDMGFNKNQGTETDPLFTPVNIANGGETETTSTTSDDSSSGSSGGKFSVPLPKFLKEIMAFIKGFTKIPSFGACCDASTNFKQALEADLAEPVDKMVADDKANQSTENHVAKLKIEANKGVIYSSGTDQITVTVTGYDDAGNIAGKKYNGELITLDISQSDGSPVVQPSSMVTTTLLDGKAVFKVLNAGGQGMAKMSASNGNGVSTENTADVISMATNVQMTSYVYMVPEGLDALQQEVAAQQQTTDTTTDNGSGTSTGSDTSTDTGNGTSAGSDTSTDTGNGTSAGTSNGGGNETTTPTDTSTGSGSDTGVSIGTDTGAGTTNNNTGTSSDTSSTGVTGSGNAGATGTSNTIKPTTEAPKNTINQTEIKDTLGQLANTQQKKNLTIIASKLLIEKQSELVTAEAATWEEYYSLENYYIKYIDTAAIQKQLDEMTKTSEETTSRESIWEQAYSINNYYKKYIEVKTSFHSTSRLMAAVATDAVARAVTTTSINPFIDADTNPNSPYMIENGDKMVANGKSLMKVSAVVINAAGHVDAQNVHKVTFSVAESDLPNMVTFENGPTVDTVDGTATIYVHAGTKTGPNDGHVKIVAKAEGNFPLGEKDIYLVAGDPYSIEMTSESGVLVANNQSKTALTFTIKDKFGNVCKNTFAQVGVFAKQDLITLDPKADSNSNILGTQVSTMEGVGTIDVYTKDKPSTKENPVKIIALLFDSDLEKAFLEAGDNWRDIDFSKYIGTSQELQVLDSVNLQMQVTANPIHLNSATNIRLQLMHNGQLVSSYNGPVKITNLNPQIIQLSALPPDKMTNGYLHEANLQVISGATSGEGEIMAEVPGFASSSIKIAVVPNAAKKIKLSSAANDYIYTNSDNVVLKATLLDEYDNIVDTDSSTPIQFGITPSSKDFVKFSDTPNLFATAIPLKGVASTTIKGLNISGNANIYAKDPSKKVLAGLLQLKVVSHVDSSFAKEFSPRALYMSILGGAFGNPLIKDNIAQIFLYDSAARAEAISSITASSQDKKRLVGVDAYGKISLMADSVEMTVVPANNSFPFQKINVSDKVAAKDLASIFLVPQGGVPIKYLENTEMEKANAPATDTTATADNTGNTGDDTTDASSDSTDLKLVDIPTQDGIYVQKLDFKNTDLTITTKSDGIYIDQAGENKAKIDVYGKISLSDESYEITLPDEANDGFKTTDFSLIITNMKNPVALITYKQNEGNVLTLPYYNTQTTFDPGIYVQLRSASSNFDLVPAFSGSSTSENFGIYLVDTTNPIDKSQAPGFPQASLDKAIDAPGLGFEGQNKHMLFFTAGNSVGESNLPYASEVGIVYGDPTVRLKVKGIVGMVSKFSGYAKTIGKPIFAGDQKIDSLLNFDYNGDGYDDILAMYENGMIRLLENQISNKRFVDRGFILNIAGGVFSATKIDVNNDGYDDLIAGSKEACTKGEACISLFINKNGNLVRQKLPLAIEGKAMEVFVGDANNDGCDDLFVSDSAGNVRVFYNKNDGNSCTGLDPNYGFTKNFGFVVDSTKNTAASLFVYYSGIDQLYNTLVVQKDKELANIDISTTGGMEKKVLLEKEIQSNRNKFIQFTLQSSGPPAAASNDQDPNFDPTKDTDPAFNAIDYFNSAAELQAAAQNNTEAKEKIIPPQTSAKEFNFLHITADTNLSATTKYSIDLNGGYGNIDDEIEYTVKLVNNGAAISNMILSDSTPTAMELLKDSLQCADANCPDQLSFEDTGMTTRSSIIKGISVPAHGVRTIKYKLKVTTLPKVRITVGKDLGDYPTGKGDPYLDIMVRPEFKTNPNVIMTHLYSTGLDTYGRVIYGTLNVGPTTDKAALLANQFANNGFPLQSLIDTTKSTGPPAPPADWTAGKDEWEKQWWADKNNWPKVDSSLKKGLTSMLQNMTVDSNFNGIPNSWDGLSDSQMSTKKQTTIPDGGDPLGTGTGSTGGSTSGSSSGGSGVGVDDVKNVGGAAMAALGNLNDMAGAAASAIQGSLNALRCGGAGCLPIPFNYAFMVPNLGIPGIPIFAWGMPVPPVFIPFLPFYPSLAVFPSMGRFYISPTLDGGLAIALCVGPGVGHASPCWSFAIPLGALGVCPDFMGMVQDAIAAAKNAVASATGGMVAMTSDGSDSGDADAAASSDTISSNESYSKPDSPIQASVGMNIRIPGFPAVITDWFDKQIAEVFNKLLDLTDLIVVLPDFGSLGPQFKSAAKAFKNNRGGWNSIHDFLRAMNDLPLITIESKEVVIKIPTIPSNQIYKYKIQAQEWLKYEKQQYENLKFWKCNGNANAWCDKFKLDFGDFIKGVESLLDLLDKVNNLPYEILKWRNWETKYATQIVCYIDSIMTMIGGYIKKQIKIIEAWMKMVEEIIRIFKSWKMIMDLIVEFEVSCDECKNSRFSLLGLLLQLFVAIPSPPIVPLPKWPDLVFDISQLNLGIKILWPDVAFRPVPITLPDLPQITVPVIPNIDIKLPGFLVDLKLPTLPELPDLPPLPIPKLPDLPRPPEIPALPNIVVKLIANLKPLLKILCLLMKGFVPVMESQLETEVETLTQPNLDVVLMIISSLAFQLPAIQYDYVEQIKISVGMNVSLDFAPIYGIVKLGAEAWNNGITGIVTKINKITQYPYQTIIDNAVKAMTDAAAAGVKSALSSTFNTGTGGNSTDSTGTQTQTQSEVDLNNLTPEQLAALKEKLGDEQFNALMDMLNSKKQTEAANQAQQDAQNKDPNIPTGTLPTNSKEPGQTLSPTDAKDVKTTSQKYDLLGQELLSYQPAQEAKALVENFSKDITDFVAALPKQKVTPDKYYLVATQTYIDPSHPSLNRSLDDVEAGMKTEDLPDTAEMKRWESLRSELIAYTKTLKDTNRQLALNLNNPEAFTNTLVNNNQSLQKIAALSHTSWENPNTYIAETGSSGATDTEGLTASMNPVVDSNGNTEVTSSFFGAPVENSIKDAAASFENIGGGMATIGESGVSKISTSSSTSSRLLAANTNTQIDASTKSGSSQTPAVAPKGFYVIIDGKNQNILNYTAELGGKVNFFFSDIDHDGDQDIIYSMGGDIYWKENYNNGLSYGQGSLLSLTYNNSISDYVNPVGNAVQGVSSPEQSSEAASVSWTASKSENIVGYQVTLRKSIYEDLDNPSYSYVALVNKTDTAESKALLDKLGLKPPVENEENPTVFELASKDTPSIPVKLPNGNYYANVFALNVNGEKSLASSFAITSPSECADKEAPFPTIDTAYKLPIMKDLEIDASGSFDSGGKITQYYVEPLAYTNGTKEVTQLPATLWSDTNVMLDSDGNGFPWDDKNNPIFKIGPFEKEGDIGIHEFILHVVDQSGNSSEQHFTVEVYVPKISLDQQITKAPIAAGAVDPVVDQMPFSLMRTRFIYRVVDGNLRLVPRTRKVQTASTGTRNKYYTKGDGSYLIDDLKTKDIITVENKDGVVIAEINPETGDIGAVKAGYSTRSNVAIPPQKPTSVDIIDAQGNTLGSVYVIADANVDVTLHQNYGFETSDYKSLRGVHVDDRNGADDFVWKNFPDSDAYYPGGAALISLKENRYLVFVDTSGNVVLVDPRMTMTQKQNDHEKDPLIFEIRFNGVVIAEIYISGATATKPSVIVAKKDVPFTTPRAPSDEALYGKAVQNGETPPSTSTTWIDTFLSYANLPDTGADDLAAKLKDLMRDGILDQQLMGTDFSLELDSAVTRAQFTKILLNMLCIIPRKPEAYTPYAATEGFSDMRFDGTNIPWYFPYIREANMADRKLIDGYRGKTDLDALTGLPPFKPDHTITLAEATKIIFSALAMEGIIDGSKLVINPADPWYKPYIDASLDLTPYLQGAAQTQGKFIITAAQAQTPYKEMTFRELLTMVIRVLDIYNCFLIDADKDGMPDYYEKKYGINDPNDDPDGDGLSNLQEAKLGTDPLDPDTDKGGAKDGEEVNKYETDPLNPIDDPFDDDQDGLTNMAEKIVYHTDPTNPDTDGDCMNDGEEVRGGTDPLDPTSKTASCVAEGTPKEGDTGIYIVPAECNTCPCISTFDHKADIIPTDTFFSIISNYQESLIFTKSEDVRVESVPKSEDQTTTEQVAQ